MAARLAELGGAAEDITDPEDVVEQVVQPDAARGDVAAKVSRRKFDSMEAQVVDDLALDERQVAADACVAPVARAGRVAVARAARLRDVRRATIVLRETIEPPAV